MECIIRSLDYNKWLTTGVEDGWIYVDKSTWESYLKAKKELDMNISIPFELGEIVYILKDVEYIDCMKWVPPDYSLGGDADGPFDRGHYENIWKTRTEIKKVKFRLGLLDKYNIDNIYKTYEDAHWALINREANKNAE